MKEFNKQNGSKIKFKYLVIAIIFIGCFSVITSYITAKTLIPVLPEFTSTPMDVIKTNTPTILPTSNLYISPVATETPTQLQIPSVESKIPIIESNLLQNGGFENGLTGWTYLEKQMGLSVYEITGINGKGFCSNQYVQNAPEYLVQDYFIGLSQEIPSIDPTQAYFFSAWVKLNKAINIYVKIDYGRGLETAGMAMDLSELSRINRHNEGKTTNGWDFIHLEIPAHYFFNATKVIISFWHGAIPDPPQIVDSTFCVDDVVFGKIVK